MTKRYSLKYDVVFNEVSGKFEVWSVVNNIRNWVWEGDSEEDAHERVKFLYDLNSI